MYACVMCSDAFWTLALLKTLLLCNGSSQASGYQIHCELPGLWREGSYIHTSQICCQSMPYDSSIWVIKGKHYYLNDLIDSDMFLHCSNQIRWKCYLSICFTSCKAHKLVLISFRPSLDSSTHFHHPHMTSKIPGNQVPCLNLVINNSWTWTLFIVKSCLLFSDPATMCSPFMYISHSLCFHPHLVYPQPCTHHTSIFTN